MRTEEFDYTIDLGTSWRPQGRPKPPYGLTLLEIFRSCPLRGCFEVTGAYPQRLGFAARVGTAFHRTLQSLLESPPGGSTEQIAEAARVLFNRELREQQAEAHRHPREQGLPQDTNRVDRAVEAVIVEALRIGGEESTVVHRSARQTPRETSPTAPDDSVPIEVEIPVQSKDGLFAGRVDRAEHRPEGTWLFDYKSAVRDDTPGRYERQLQLYALMWHDTRGEWPVAGRLVYPLTGTVHEVSVEPEVCRGVAEETKALLARLKTERSAEKLGTPGDVCSVCSFRPWCKPFWDSQAAETTPSVTLDGTRLGVEGTVTRIGLNGGFWKMEIAWRRAKVQLIAPEERFPHLQRCEVGTHVRVLDAPLKGLRHQPRAVVSEYSEVFLVTHTTYQGRRGEGG